MPQRIVNFWLAVAGLAALAGLVLIGLDVRRLARSGPKWRRRLLGAGLVLLAALHVPGCGQPSDLGQTPAMAAADVKAPRGDLNASSHWRHLVDVWRRAEDVAGGRYGPQPLSPAGKDRLLRELDAIGRDIDALAKSDFLTTAEAGLLREDLAVLTLHVDRLTPWDRGIDEGQEVLLSPDGSDHRGEQLAVLEKLPAGGAIHAAVADRLLRPVRRYADELRPPVLPLGWSEDERTRALRKRLGAVAHRLESAPRADSGELARSKAWQRLAAAWDQIEGLVSRGAADAVHASDAEKRLAWLAPYVRSRDEVDQEQALGAMAAARRDIDALRRAGLLSRFEADALAARHATLVAEAGPSDLTYWAGMARRLDRRLPMLRRLADGPRPRPQVLEIVLRTVDADLAMLAVDLESRPREPSGLFPGSVFGGGTPPPPSEIRQAASRQAKAAVEIEREARRLVERIRARQPAPTGPLERTAVWQRVKATWNESVRVGRRWRGVYPHTEFGRRHTLGRLGGAIADVDALARAGLLTGPEAELLRLDLKDLQHFVRYQGTFDMRGSICYEAGPPLWPQTDALTFLTPRLKLLARSLDAGRLRPEVAAPALAAVEMAIEHADTYSGAIWPDDKIQRRDEIVAAVRKAAERIRARLGGKGERLEATPQWRRVLRAWKLAAAPALTGRSTAARRARADQALAEVLPATNDLSARGLLTVHEARILQDEARYLREAMHRHPPDDRKHPRYVPFYDEGWEGEVRTTWLAGRLNLYHRLDAGVAVRPAVLELVRQAAQADVRALAEVVTQVLDRWKREGGRPGSETGTGGLFGGPEPKPEPATQPGKEP